MSGAIYGSHPGELVATGYFTVDQEGAIARISGSGYSNITRSGVGVYQITLARPCDVTCRAVVCDSPGANANIAKDDPPNGTDNIVQLLVRAALTGESIDGPVAFTVHRCDPKREAPVV